MSAPKADYVQARLARILIQPSTNRAKQSNRTLNASAVGLYAGFVLRAQHTIVWSSLPQTMAALRHKDIELKLFARYQKYYRAEIVPAMHRDHFVRLTAFVAFATEHLERIGARRQDSSLKGAATLMRHEFNIASASHSALCLGSRRQTKVDAASSIRRAQGVMLVNYACDPREVLDSIIEKRQLCARPTYLTYRLTAVGIDVREVTEQVFHLLNGLGDIVSVAHVLHSMRCFARDGHRRQMLWLLRRLLNYGLIEIARLHEG